MSLAIEWGDSSVQDGGFIYLSAVTAYTQNYSGSVTKHPVDQGGNITDHFVRNNPVITIGAVITGVDISTGTYLIQDLDGNSPYNSNQAPNAVSVNSTDQSVLKKFIPDSIGQFLSDSTPEVVVDSRRADLLEQIRQALIDLTAGVVFNDKTGNFDPSIQLVRLFEYDNTLLRKVINNLVMTKITFKEDPNTGYGLYCDITFEQVTFAFLKKTTIPKDVQDSLKKKASSKASKGKQDSTPQNVDGAAAGSNAPKDTDPLRQARENG
jgi:Dit-like tail protein